jgi:protein subunit release factor B
MKQCQMDTFKSSGPGGQHRNKRESAVRLKHLPTGIIAQVFFFFFFFFFLNKYILIIK